MFWQRNRPLTRTHTELSDCQSWLDAGFPTCLFISVFLEGQAHLAVGQTAVHTGWMWPGSCWISWYWLIFGKCVTALIHVPGIMFYFMHLCLVLCLLFITKSYALLLFICWIYVMGTIFKSGDSVPLYGSCRWGPVHLVYGSRTPLLCPLQGYTARVVNVAIPP